MVGMGSMDVIAEANRIKDRLRACKTRAEVEDVADQERAQVKAMHDQGGEPQTLAGHIVRLKEQCLRDLE